MRTRRARLVLTLAVVTAVMLPGTARAAPGTAGSTTKPDRLDQQLGQGWRDSADRLWVTNGDATGLHVMVAEARTGYAWRTVATLNQPGVEADRWIGNACVTGSGRRAVVVYAPRTFTNKAQLARRGGYTAVVDLVSGAVRRLPVRTSLAYFNPGCGAGETAVLTQEGDEDLGRTRLLTVAAASGVLGKRVEVRGQLTSAVPTRKGIVAAAAGSVVRVGGDGRTTPVAKATGVPFRLRPDADDQVVFMQTDGDDRVSVRRTAPGNRPPATLASGPPGQIDLRGGAGGRVFVTGQARPAGALPSTVTKLDAPSSAQVSTLGEATITEVRPADATADPATAARVRLAGTSLKTRQPLAYTVDPAAAKPAAALPAAAAVTPLWGETPDPDRVCAVPRNDPSFQVLQPKPKQVEWAVDIAVKGHLLITRSGPGIGSYKPQEMFPPVPLRGGGQVPAQVMLGILGQESNLWQASRHVLPGETGNPLIGNYYGLEIYNDTEADDWDIDWAEADCGYGVSQMTDGMRLAGKERPGEVALPWAKQVAIGTDYAANVAAGLRLLQTKWNEIWDAGMRMNNGDPSRIENWFFAAWAYNSGFHQPGESGSNGAWGLGWLNNPINPRYNPSRHNFGSDPHDFAHPQDWPYPEKVLGFASDPPSGFEAPGVEVPFFRAAWWNGGECGGGGADIPECALYNKRHAFPEPYRFCTADNDCDVNASHLPNAPEVVGEPAGPCGHRNSAGQYDLKCWVHTSVIWKGDCDYQCGREFIRYDSPDYDNREPEKGVSYPPVCDREGLFGLSAQTINDVSDATPPIRDPECNGIGLNRGTLAFAFAKDAAGRESSKIDFHQVGGGYGAHFWFSHSYRDDALGRKLKVTGTWSFDTTVDGYAEVLVHMPKHSGVFAGNAEYTINTAHGPVTASPGQHGARDEWVSLGKYPFFGKPTVQQTNITVTGDGSEKVIWDAVAIRPMYEGPGDYRYFFNRAAPNCPVLHENSPSGGGVVEQRTCTVWHINNWIFDNLTTDGDEAGPYRIVDRGSGLCLGVLGNSTDAGALVQVATCDPENTSQRWRVDEVRQTDINNTSVQLIVNQRSSLCLRPLGGSLASGRALEQAPCALNGDNELTDFSEGWRVTELNPE